ncbi:MAG: class I SAM-dependent RNA methyltransferase [Oscillospiraceae bacterium]|nr:class I SAM-dependent RNA methyltransferase [Oscillospiraceae bacterium]
MKSLQLCAPCLFGLEGILGNELRRMDADNVKAENGRVFFEGGPEILARANICSRYAERIQVVMGRFEAKSFDCLFENVRSLPWEQFIGKKDRFPVKGWSLESALHSVPDCQSIIKKAVVERLKEKYRTSWFDETGVLYQIQFTILKDEVTVLVDSSGSGLHKRGYRAIAGVAPLKETLAAAIVDLARARKARRVFDPCCGSGTLLIESALAALGIAPGIRRKFSSSNWSQVPDAIWKQERDRARQAERRDVEFSALGSDIDKQAVALTMENAKLADVGKVVSATYADLSDFKTDDGGGVVLCNPPYGERLADINQAERLIRIMGRVFKPGNGWSYYIISSHERFEKLFGRPADKRRKLYNGMLKCQLYMYYR